MIGSAGIWPLRRDSTVNAVLEMMIDAAADAGRIACRYYRTSADVREKADRSPVTDADEAAEAAILERLAREQPGIPVVAEEQVAAGRVPALGASFFLVDPLDGTKEFIAGRTDFTINIALVEQQEPVLGVVYAPARGMLYAGDVLARRAVRDSCSAEVAGPLAFEPIAARRVPDDGGVAVASRSHASPETIAFLERLGTTRTVSVGSSLKFCLIAEGEADVYPRFGTTMEWDTAAGHAVLAAAGGSVRTTDGEPLRYAKREFRNPWFVAVGAGSMPHVLPIAAP